MIKFWWHLLVQLNCCFQNLEVLFKYDVKCLLSRSTQNRPPFWVGSCCSFVKLHIAILFPLCDVCYDFCVTRCSLRLCFRAFVRRYIFICLREFCIKWWLCRLKINTTGTTSGTGIELAPVFEGSYFSIFSFLCVGYHGLFPHPSSFDHYIVDSPLAITSWVFSNFVLCLVYPMLPVSLDCPFIIAPSIFS
jgi:hypothetical protein